MSWPQVSTVIPWCSLASDLVKCCIHHIFMTKYVSALSTCLGLIALARTCTSHAAAPQEKMLHSSVFIGFGTHHEFRNEFMMSSRVPLYMQNPVERESMILGRGSHSAVRDPYENSQKDFCNILLAFPTRIFLIDVL